MTRNMMIHAEDFAIELFGPHTEVEIEDDGSAYVTTPHGVIHAFFAFDHEDVTRLTIFP